MNWILPDHFQCGPVVKIDFAREMSESHVVSETLSETHKRKLI